VAEQVHTPEEACPFCEYVGPSKIVATSADSYAITPLNPVVDGHLLVIPRVHVADFAAEPAVTAAVFADAARIAQELVDGDCNLITSKGPAGTQTVRHLHVHVVPRRTDDGLALPWSPGNPRYSADEVRERLTRLLAELDERAGEAYRDSRHPAPETVAEGVAEGMGDAFMEAMERIEKFWAAAFPATTSEEGAVRPSTSCGAEADTSATGSDLSPESGLDSQSASLVLDSRAGSQGHSSSPPSSCRRESSDSDGAEASGERS